MQATFIAQLDALHAMLEWVRSALEQLHVKEEYRNNIELACEEALVNIINYSYQEDSYQKGQGNIIIACTRSGPQNTQLVITLLDQGAPHNPLHSIHIPTPERIGGYGVFLILKLMDHVDYRHIDGNNELTLIKNDV